MNYLRKTQKNIGKTVDLANEFKRVVLTSKQTMLISGLISIIEFSEGVFFGKVIENITDNIDNIIPQFNNSTSNKYNLLYNQHSTNYNIYREIIIVFIQLFITGCFVITLRNFNKIIGIGTLKEKNLKNFPPPVALSFGIWYYQHNLRKRIDYIFKYNKFVFIILAIALIPTIMFFFHSYIKN